MSNNKKLIIYSLGVVGLIAAVFGLSYAYFESDVAGNNQASSIITLTENVNIIYTDGPEVYIENLYPTKSITKDIMIENNGNTGALFKLEYINLINQVTNDEMVVNFTCEAYKNYGTGTQSEVDCFPMDSRVIPTHLTSSTETIEEALYIGPGITKIYHVKAQFLETGSNQSYNMGKRFSAKINVVDTPCDTNSQDLKCKILADNTEYADNRGTQYVKSNTGINFSEISSDTNGKGLYYTTDPTKTEGEERVYYFRGEVENNYLYYAGYCWRIVRTNEDGSVKLRYGGNPTISGSNVTCLQTGQSSSGSMYIGINNNATVAFNYDITDNTRIGYMFGLAGVTTIGNRCLMLESNLVVDKIRTYPTQNICESSGGKWTTTAYEATHANIKDSRIKTIIDTWYSTNIANNNSISARIKSLVADTPYCNDRSLHSDYTTKGYGTEETKYKSYERIINEFNVQPIYKCANQNDRFTVNNSFGNKSLTYSVGLLTIDEINFSGANWWFLNGRPNTNYYPYTGLWHWSMSPYLFNGSYAYIIGINSSGALDYTNAASGYIVLPAISLNTTAKVASGTGSYNNPYRIE